MKTTLLKVMLVLATFWLIVVSYIFLLGFLFAVNASDGPVKIRIGEALIFVFAGLGPLFIVLALMKWKGMKFRESKIYSLRLNNGQPAPPENEKKSSASGSA